MPMPQIYQCRAFVSRHYQLKRRLSEHGPSISFSAIWPAYILGLGRVPAGSCNPRSTRRLQCDARTILRNYHMSHSLNSYSIPPTTPQMNPSRSLDYDAHIRAKAPLHPRCCAAVRQTAPSVCVACCSRLFIALAEALPGGNAEA